MEDIQIFCEECVRIVSVASPCGHYELEQEESREVEVLEEEHKHNVNEEKSITPDTQFDSWEEILIAMVHDRPVLWDSRLALSARSKTIRDKLWKEISDALGDLHTY
ncbi:hypothetical protein RI129_007091 [Pyrocoelia pectoralis]|uniref:MADF domain-containing protein n=1 Tax=Pyrocoelia pectoralis TaxID=417401 RepID=A0AAN7VDT1_9COLE